ncbi:hypothetical protein H8959_018613, partial [Pygathrix nigripes]
ESAVNLVRSGSYTRQLWRDEAKGNETPQTTAPSTYVSTYLKRTPHKSQADSTAEKTADNVSSSTPLCVITNRPLPSTANGVTATPVLSITGTDSSVEAREKRRRMKLMALKRSKKHGMKDFLGWNQEVVILQPVILTVTGLQQEPVGRPGRPRLATLTSRVEEDSNRDYKKLYESALTENQKLKTKLQEAQLELADIKSKLEKVTQKQEKTSDRSSVLEMEKRERRALERKMSEMEEEMKVLTELKSDNQRLKDENGALIRVISKLSK